MGKHILVRGFGQASGTVPLPRPRRTAARPAPPSPRPAAGRAGRVTQRDA
jgi:hypothetical protein